jgi:hypothetical protein
MFCDAAEISVILDISEGDPLKLDDPPEHPASKEKDPIKKNKITSSNLFFNFMLLLLSFHWKSFYPAFSFFWHLSIEADCSSILRSSLIRPALFCMMATLSGSIE